MSARRRCSESNWRSRSTSRRASGSIPSDSRGSLPSEARGPKAGRLPSPFLLCPLGVLEMVHDDADLAVARAAAKEGVPMIFSNQASRPMEECARELHVKMSTVRSQLLSVFAKTGATGQSDLVRLILSASAI